MLHKVDLFDMLVGNRYADPVKVSNPYNVTGDELNQMTRGTAWELYTEKVIL